MQKFKKQLLLFSGILLGCLALISLIWFCRIGARFFQYGLPMKHIDDLGRMEADGYYYIVKPAGYLSYETGHLSVYKKDEKQISIDPAANHPFYYTEFGERVSMDNWKDWYAIDFSYYPRTSGKSFYGIGYQTIEPNADGALDFVLHFIYFDKNFQPLNGEKGNEIKEFRKVLDEHHAEILDLMEHADKMWGLKYE